ncbi:uncharacterized protein LOC129739241 [Uranotaenia lowii]|uniref:uncharacterized protein LOC129739241 n=1 Tax=Uranotaenia lowii TaxID=190385 RepID=UPI0024797877|nr:uncharacterized protein LOC129739241 [Uranotaenia lowii]
MAGISRNVPVLLLAMVLVSCVWVDPVQGNKDCSDAESTFLCYGRQMLRTVLKRLANERSLRLMPGIEIVEISHSPEERERAFNEVDGSDGASGGGPVGILQRVARYLANHELKINLGELARRSDLQDVVRSTLKTMSQDVLGGDLEEARKKDKGGAGTILMMGVMMSKLLGALGFGGVALLAMKALGVSMLALMLSAILGLKKLAEGGEHKGRQNAELRVAAGESGGHESDHQGGYTTIAESSHSKRRRRSTNSPYRGWAGLVQ